MHFLSPEQSLHFSTCLNNSVSQRFETRLEKLTSVQMQHEAAEFKRLCRALLWTSFMNPPQRPHEEKVLVSAPLLQPIRCCPTVVR